jgi:16S rRNA (adenine1518-N6/adenine1519-N6)-dimethyltransferase
MKARKRFGQHFLEPAWVAKVVEAVDPQPDDRFLEIGPGRGALTVPLAKRARSIVAVEVDRDLAAALSSRALPNVKVVTADVLAINVVDLAEGEPTRVVGNLPYNISSPILFRLLEASASDLLRDATLMLQKEVADRLVAAPGTSEYGVLTLQAALAADVTLLLALPPGAFRPVPKVRSAVVRFSFRPPPPEVHDPQMVVAIVRSIFTQRRKTLSNALAPFATSRGRDPHEVLLAAGIDGRRRPETLDLADVAGIADVFAAG